MEAAGSAGGTAQPPLRINKQSSCCSRQGRCAAPAGWRYISGSWLPCMHPMHACSCPPALADPSIVVQLLPAAAALAAVRGVLAGV